MLISFHYNVFLKCQYHFIIQCVSKISISFYYTVSFKNGNIILLYGVFLKYQYHFIIQFVSKMSISFYYTVSFRNVNIILL